ncbi:PTS system, mannitol-specific IIC component [Selenomonas ruminantium]|uniref:Mannitol-specific phosphotransferase enzyme IIA component n=1 Tax=Selenomonas ruminantium TaxID=971 RepID=A0A1M6R1Z8_SELRU|nr:PTS mannitol transporter subunit IICBA [Selenomonas ruminantium]SHK26377.1 PTS system, mannitol-specific IIC component [Selenomonas ruminantium]
MSTATASAKGFNFQEAMQKFGRFLSGMVLPNIGAFIAWGLLTALFIPTGWLPNEYLAQVGGPMSKWLIPLLLGYSGGAAIYSHRGGVLGAIATSGVIAGADIPMFLGAMIMGPLAGYLIKKFDKAIENAIPTGFEMLINNFSAGIMGGILAVLAYVGVGPVVLAANGVLRAGVEGIVAVGLLPLASIIIEPAKILFLNNAINHGVLSPLGIQQAEEFGKSMFFLLEANPGPGLGVLLAYWFFGKGMAKDSTPGAMIIHLLGGIHEIYFPYVLMKPVLLIAVIAGGMAGVATLQLFDGGLIAPSSPGSILAVLAMTPKGAFIANMADFLVATVVSCAVASVFVKVSASEESGESLAEAKEAMQQRKQRGQLAVSAVHISGSELRNIVYACDAGMGSSALGAASLRKKLRAAGYTEISVTNAAIGNIPKEAQIVVTHEKLAQRAIEDSPQAEHILVRNFTQNDVYEQIIERLSANKMDGVMAAGQTGSREKHVLDLSNIQLGLKSVSKEDAITAAGRALVQAGFVEESYIDGMLKREADISTYVGKGIAIPHGEAAVKDSIRQSGIVVLQYPEGIKFGKETAHILVGIAGKDNDHLSILANIAATMDECSDEELEQLYKTKDANVLYERFALAN